MSFLTPSQTILVPRHQSHPFPLIPPLHAITTNYLPWKRRRLKRSKTPNSNRVYPLLRNNLEPLPSTSSSPFDILSLLPDNWIPPAFAAAFTTAALVFSLSTRRTPVSSSKSNSTSGGGVGEWVLFTSPTPFNRFVLLRCPSIAFEGGELLENVSDKLVKEDKHYVRLDSGRIIVGNDGEAVEERVIETAVLEYQRVCVTTEDGGVISLDWPAKLDMSEERGLDTTVLIVPGTTQGSMDESVKEFVRDCLKRGFFPVVMNPRGCAGSPLTTARLFTAADSDDVCSAIQFISRARPWSTLTGVGWGFGANMLTKYLAEAGEKTPLTAAACIDNPFDLDEATRTSPYSTAIDMKLTSGLIDILKTNKELFQGRSKGFDVERALVAESLRDFEVAISMVSHGYDSVEDFYSNSSTRSVVGDLKIPVLFIQNDDGSVPLFSIPRALIAENPYTSLLLCSCLPSHVTAISWYQQVTIEWLTAVELGLLKGRHPLLQDIDVTINPSKGLALMEGRGFDSDAGLRRVLNLKLDSSDAYLNSMKLDESDYITAGNVGIESSLISQKNEAHKDHVLSETNGAFQHSDSMGLDYLEQNANDPDANINSQVLQTAQVVMNMLDVSMPGTLKEAEKKKVLEAVGQGETLIKALQDAVPEEVRGKLTSSVSEIVQAQGKNLNLDGLLSISQITNVSAGNTKIKGLVSKQPDVKTENNGCPSGDNISIHDSRSSTSNQTSTEKSGGEAGTSQSPENSSDSPATPEKDSVDSQNNDIKLDRDANGNKVGQLSEIVVDGPETKAELTPSSETAGCTNSLDPSFGQNNKSQDYEASQGDSKERNRTVLEGNLEDLSQEQRSTTSVTDSTAEKVETPAPSTAESQLSENDDNNRQGDEKPLQSLPDQTKASDAKSSSFSVSQALDALTGLDDSTQVAVNSVFGVIEDMINQLEEKQNENTLKKGDKDVKVTDIKENHVISELKLEKFAKGENQEDGSHPNMELGNSDYIDNNMESVNDEDNSNTNLIMGAKGDSLHAFAESQNVKSSNMAASTALFLHYLPEGRWILLEKPRGLHKEKGRLNVTGQLTNRDDIIEPSYVIVGKNRQEESAEELNSKTDLDDKLLNCNSDLDTSTFAVKTILLDSLEVEVGRRLDATDMKDVEADLAADMEKVADAVCLALRHGEEQSETTSFDVEDVEGWSRINGDFVIEAISKAVQDTSCLRRVLPIGVIVGSCLAALKSISSASAIDDSSDRTNLLDKGRINGLKPKGLHPQPNVIEVPVGDVLQEPILEKNQMKERESVTLELPVDKANTHSKLLNKDTVMAGAVTAALGASALFLDQQEGFMGNASPEASINSAEKHVKKVSVKLEEDMDNKQQSNIVTSLAEKAMSVAAPVVPTTEDGEVDHERIVTMLAELGQRGGVLRLVAKLALLWGGLRGAMSLTDRLISFLRVAERPLMQRLLGFSCMVLVLWSPVLVPLLPTLFHNMATHSSSKIADFACIVGLYSAVTILITQWGKRIRGYKFPLKQYGLDFKSSRKVQDLLIGLVGGVALVLSIHSVNALLGFVSFSSQTQLIPSSLHITGKLKAYGQLCLLAGRGFLMAACVAFVEELLFRSWLLEEIAADLGYHLGIILSGVVFALSQRSLLSIPGLWLLSICLAGARLKKKGSLFISIGLRTGIMSSCFVLQMGGFLTYHLRSQFWVFGMHPFQPFNGVVGILFVLVLSVVLYPRQPGLMGKVPRTIRG